jgi:hypothetical protein
MHPHQRQDGPGHCAGRQKLRGERPARPLYLPLRTHNVDRPARSELPHRRERLHLRSLRVQGRRQRSVEAQHEQHHQVIVLVQVGVGCEEEGEEQQRRQHLQQCEQHKQRRVLHGLRDAPSSLVSVASNGSVQGLSQEDVLFFSQKISQRCSCSR